MKMKMKIIILLSALSLLATERVYAQVGINTLNPQNGALHIDPAGNNATTGTPLQSETSDDLLIDNNGKVSIGHINPTSQLHIISGAQGAIKIEDGTQNTYKGVLTSDVNGYGTWQDNNMACIQGVLSTNGVSTPLSAIPSSTTWIKSGASITLPKGRWVVYVSMLLTITGVTNPTSDQKAWIRSTFYDQSNSRTDIQGAFLLSGVAYAQGYGMLDGFIVIDNRTSAAKKYDYMLGQSDANSIPSSATIHFASSAAAENYILALKMKDL